MLRPSAVFSALLFLAVPVANSKKVAPHPKDQRPQNVFEDDRIRVEIPAGWSVRTATTHVIGDRSFELPIGALLTKGKYKLYLLSHQGQASGIRGGRFSEVVHYISPWVDMSESADCPIISRTHNYDSVATNRLTRQDLYFDTIHANRKALVDCGSPAVKGTLWYGSYFFETCKSKDTPPDCGGGFFLTYQDLSGKPPRPRTVNGSTGIDYQMVYAITFDTKKPDDLPMKGDPNLGATLREASGIVRSIVYK